MAAPQSSVPAVRPVGVAARARRVGEVPAPRVRPLVEVLARGRPDEAAPAPADGLRTRQAQDDLDRLAAALRPLAARLLTAVGDVLAGRRPAAHLGDLLTPDALATLARAAAPPGRPGPPGRTSGPGSTAALRGLRVCPVGPRAVEVAAVVPGRDRARALAARLERADEGPADPGRWRVVALCPG